MDDIIAARCISDDAGLPVVCRLCGGRQPE